LTLTLISSVEPPHVAQRYHPLLKGIALEVKVIALQRNITTNFVGRPVIACEPGPAAVSGKMRRSPIVVLSKARKIEQIRAHQVSRRILQIASRRVLICATRWGGADDTDDTEDLFSRSVLAAFAVVTVQTSGRFDEHVVALRLRGHRCAVQT
jgi:hypothetical protein